MLFLHNPIVWTLPSPIPSICKHRPKSEIKLLGMANTVEVDEDLVTTEDYTTQSDIPRTSSDPENYSDDSRYVEINDPVFHIDHHLRGSTRSLKSAPELILENGRYYCNDTYFMPCDEDEQTRLSILYQTYLFLLDHQITLGVVPRNPKRILEVGTGTGDWAMAVAERFPNASVIALDITSAYFPGAAPPNVSFELDNAQHEWTYNEPFDFIHIRELSGAFSDWAKIYKEVARHLKSGGILEVADRSLIKLTNEVSSPIARWPLSSEAQCRLQAIHVSFTASIYVDGARKHMTNRTPFA